MEPVKASTHHNHGNEGPARDEVHPLYTPYWKRAHHDWRFWVAFILMIVAITIYVLSENLAFLPHG
jgi:hypothetical protein